MSELEVIDCNMHGAGNPWCFIKLEFHTIASATVQKEQIEFRTAVGRPEKLLAWTEDLQALAECEPFPGSA
ncbi:MAG: hypothetical protein P8Z73_11530, partial [Desulfobacteraceae bacterium]